MECREVRRLVHDVAAGADPSIARSVREHAAVCAECGAELARAERLRALLAASRDSVRPPDNLTASVRRRIIHEHGVPRPAGLPAWVGVPLVAAVAVTLVFGAIYVGGRTMGTATATATTTRPESSAPVVVEAPQAPADEREALAHAAAWNTDTGAFEDNAVGELARAQAASCLTTSLDR